MTPAEQIERLEERIRTLSGALRGFSEATTNYEVLLEVVGRTLAEVVRDGCVVRLLGDDGWLSPVAIHMPIEARVSDQQLVTRLREHMSRPHNINSQGAAREVIESGNAQIYPELDLSQMRQSTAPEIVAAYEAIGIHSLLLVPLRVHGQSIGLLALVRFQPD